MKHVNKSLHRQRAMLDARLEKARPAIGHLATPRGGWIRAVRESLGMTAVDLAKRMGVTPSVVLRLEQSEVRKTITLGSLDRAARAMGCQLAWLLFPPGTLESQLDARARLVAARRMRRTTHSMALENQRPGDEHTAADVGALARELKDKLATGLWSDP